MDQGGAVTVHTTIRYVDADCATLKLNGVAVAWTYADGRGYPIAEFNEAAVKAIVAAPGATLTVTWSKKTGESFSGSDTVRVIP